jgi:hypothetical protein
VGSSGKRRSKKRVGAFHLIIDLSQIIDQVEKMREELLSIQRALERIEPAEDAAVSDRWEAEVVPR